MISLIKRKLAKKQVLFLGITLSCYTVGYLVGYYHKLYSGKTITQQLQSPSKPAQPQPVSQPQHPSKLVALKNKTAIQIRLIVKRGTRRVYVYRGKQVLRGFPIAIGKSGWETPLGNYQVISMKKNPIFRNFKTGQIINPDSTNPLGKRLIVFKIGKKFNLAFHGTNQDKLIGQAVSHGCIRMHNKDVIALYELVNIGTPISVLP